MEELLSLQALELSENTSPEFISSVSVFCGNK